MTLHFGFSKDSNLNYILPDISPRLNAAFGPGILGVPIYIDRVYLHEVARDIQAVYNLSRQLPKRLDDGNIARFASRLGYPAEQAKDFDRFSKEGLLEILLRADLYSTESGFRLLEINATSALGGLEIADVNAAIVRGLPSHTLLDKCHFDDPFLAVKRVINRESGRILAGTVCAVVDLEQNIPSSGGSLRNIADSLSVLGLESIACSLKDLTIENGSLRVGERVVGSVFRHFPVEDLYSVETRDELQQLVATIDAVGLPISSRLDAELYGNKAILAILSEGLFKDFLTPSEKNLIQRFIPWTRVVQQESTDEHGRPVNLERYMHESRLKLVLKPTHLYGGKGVMTGWNMTEPDWQRAVRQTLTDGNYIVQRRVEPRLEPFPRISLEAPSAMVLNWGVFVSVDDPTNPSGYAGSMVRTVSNPDVGVLSHTNGALIACVFSD